MTYEVVVVGAGLGGLTVGALLAARGVNVCVLERDARGGGCAQTFEHGGYDFENGAGLYAGWQPGEIHARVFAELPVAPPEVRLVSPAYVVRLPDAINVNLAGSDEGFAAELRRAFPECAEAAINFYLELAPIAEALRRTLTRAPDLLTASKLRRLKLLTMEPRLAARLNALRQQTAAEHLAGTSHRFRRFIDAQLQIFAQRASDSCAYLYASIALTLPRRGLYAMRGGATALIDALTASITQSGGTIRFDATALHLVCDASHRALGVDLLNGETVRATRAVVSDLTIWDTYGKLVGLKRTPAHIRARLQILRGWGAYQLYLGLDETAATRLPSERILALTDWQEQQAYDPTSAQFMFSAAPSWDTRAPAGQRAVTVSTFTEAESWFAYHEDETEHEARDQMMLEKCWARLHASLPELGAGVEVIETATPRTYYERTRRKLGMIGGLGQTLDVFGAHALTHRTPIPNLFRVGDTTFPGQGVAAVTHSALIVADEMTK